MAIKFKYSMQSILQYRQSIEDIKKSLLAKANMRLREEKARLLKLEEELELSIQKKLEKIKSNVSDEIIFNNHIESCEARIRDQKQQVFRAEEEAEHARKELEAATKNVKIMESLSEKEFERFIADLDMKEAKELDEMATTRFGKEDDF